MNSTILAFFLLGLAVLEVSSVFDSPKGFPAPQGHPLSKNKTTNPLQLDNNEDEDEDEDKNLRQTLKPGGYPNLINSIGAVFGARPEFVNKSVENFAEKYNYKKNPTTASAATEETTLLPVTEESDEDEDKDGDEQRDSAKTTNSPLQFDSEDEDEEGDKSSTRQTLRPALYPNLISVLGTALGASPEAVNKSVENFVVGYNYGKNPTTESVYVRPTLPAGDEDEDEDEDGEEQDAALNLKFQ